MINPKEPNVSEHSLRSPQSRYVLPSFVERTSYGVKEMNPYNKLFEERIIFLGVQIDDASANDVMAQLLTLEAIDPDREITIYINSPGGSMTSMMAIYDTMQFVKPDVRTICVGMAMSAAAMILCGGAAGKRSALPNAKMMIHQGSAGFRGTPSDIDIHAREVLSVTRRMAEIIARHSSRDVDQVMQDIDRDNFMSPDEAVTYGLIDDVVMPRAVKGLTPKGSDPEG
jgi:ATP-dependent Clp protease protease subunit